MGPYELWLEALAHGPMVAAYGQLYGESEHRAEGRAGEREKRKITERDLYCHLRCDDQNFGPFQK